MLSYAAPEIVPEAAIMLIAYVPQRLWSRRSKFLLNQVGRINNQILRFKSKSLLFDNDEPIRCKEAMMGPDSVKWLEAIKSVIVPYTRNQVLNLEDPPKRCKNLSVVFGYIKKQTWMFHIYEIVDMSVKYFTTMFKEFTMTRFDLS